MAKITSTEWEALRLVCSGMSDVQAYRKTHQKAKKASAEANASKYFRRVRSKLSTDQELQLRNLGKSRVFEEIEKRLNADYYEYFMGEECGVHADNATRMRATELLAKINGLLAAPQDNADNEAAGGIKIIVDKEETC